MSELSKEEIIKYFKEVIIWYRENTPDRVYALNNKDIEMLQGLLDLYNKEKEKNKKSKKENEALEIIHESYKEMLEENNIISKDKIKELLNKNKKAHYLLKSDIQELLEERN